MKSKKKINRRQFVKDASTVVAGASVIAAGSGAGLGLFPKSALAANVRRDILRIPGVVKGRLQIQTGRKSVHCALIRQRHKFQRVNLTVSN